MDNETVALINHLRRLIDDLTARVVELETRLSEAAQAIDANETNTLEDIIALRKQLNAAERRIR